MESGPVDLTKSVVTVKTKAMTITEAATSPATRPAWGVMKRSLATPFTPEKTTKATQTRKAFTIIMTSRPL